MSTVLLATGIFRLVVCLAGLYWCLGGREMFPLAAKFAITGMALLCAQATAVILVGLGVTALTPIASMLAAAAVGAIVAVFALTAQR